MSRINNRLLFLLNDAKFLISHRLELACAAHQAGYEVHIATAGHAKSEELFHSHGFFFHRLNITRSGINPIKELKTLLRIFRAIFTLKPDILFLITIKSVLYGGISARICGVPAVTFTISGRGYVFINHDFKARVLQHIARVGYRIALGHRNSTVIFQNPDDRQFFIDCGLVKPEKTALVRGAGVNLKTFYPAVREHKLPIKVIMTARLLRDKGVYEYLEAARILKTAGHPIKFLLVGGIDPGNPASLTPWEFDAIMARGEVKCLNQRSDVAHLYRKCHIACLPSYAEGLPKALLEALACALPVVTTDVPGCREVVEHGKNGLLVPARDPRALAEAILCIANDYEMRQRMRHYSRKKAETLFDVQLVIRETFAIFETLQQRAMRTRHADA